MNAQYDVLLLNILSSGLIHAHDFGVEGIHEEAAFGRTNKLGVNLLATTGIVSVQDVRRQLQSLF